jgi:hypothetical protein
MKLSGQTLTKHQNRVEIITKQISEQLNRLAKHKMSLEQYMEMNRSLANELRSTEGCLQLSKDKLLM